MSEVKKFKNGDILVFKTDGDLAKVVDNDWIVWLTFEGNPNHVYVLSEASVSIVYRNDEFRLATPLEKLL